MRVRAVCFTHGSPRIVCPGKLLEIPYDFPHSTFASNILYDCPHRRSPATFSHKLDHFISNGGITRDLLISPLGVSWGPRTQARLSLDQVKYTRAVLSELGVSQ